jgi:hypothetical protein
MNSSQTAQAVEPRFFAFSQNNSGGSFTHHPEAGIGYYVFIEARDAREANRKAEEIGIYFDGCDSGVDCGCCGDRWHEVCGAGDPVPSAYGTPVESTGAIKNQERWGLKSYIHYMDGRIETVE